MLAVLRPPRQRRQVRLRAGPNKEAARARAEEREYDVACSAVEGAYWRPMAGVGASKFVTHVGNAWWPKRHDA